MAGMWKLRGYSGAAWLSISSLLLLVAGCAGGAPNMAAANHPVAPPNPSGPNQPPPVPQQAGSVTISPQNAAAAPGQGVHFTATVNGGGAVTWSVNGIAGGNATVGTIDTRGNYTAPASVGQSENVVVEAALTSAPASFASAPVAIIQPGVVTATSNPLVAEYSIYLPQPGNMTVQFGSSPGSGLDTWSQATPTQPHNYGGEINMEVGGMRGSSTYHLRASITLANGVTFQDVDHPFTTGTAPATVPVQISTPSGQTPQPGIELFDTVTFGSKPIPNLAQAFATDLTGNVIWTYNYTGSPANVIFPIKQLPNGHFIMVIGFVAAPSATQNTPAGTLSVVREVDLVGNTIRELSIDQLNKSLAGNTSVRGDGAPANKLVTFSTDVLQQPNGHLLVIAWMVKPYPSLPGCPTSPCNVLGNVVVDLDQNFQPTWVWNAFRHLDINRHPYQFPDFTHANALLYSSDDHNLLLSIRQQNWVVKIDYQDGTGSGNILWRLGQGGDFKLLGGIDPTDWFYAQHGINFFTANTTGVFKLGVMDNGNDRLFPGNITCGTPGAPACYSTAEVMQVDETAKTATILLNYKPNPPLYSYFGGQTDLLQNNDVETDFCASKGGATIFELDTTQKPAATVWQAHTPGYNQYRVVRIPSLYPGVQW